MATQLTENDHTIAKVADKIILNKEQQLHHTTIILSKKTTLSLTSIQLGTHETLKLSNLICFHHTDK